jgi:hypothetical protein
MNPYEFPSHPHGGSTQMQIPPQTQPQQQAPKMMTLVHNNPFNIMQLMSGGNNNFPHLMSGQSQGNTGVSNINSNLVNPSSNIYPMGVHSRIGTASHSLGGPGLGYNNTSDLYGSSGPGIGGV